MNYKIKVNSEDESREVQELFFELGGAWISVGTCVDNTRDSYLFLTGSYITCESDDFNFFKKHQNKEITLPQLRDIVVLKRNDVGDKNAWDGSRWDLYLTSDNKLYFHDGDVWKESKSSGKEEAHSKLKPIKKENGMLGNKEALLALANGEEVLYINTQLASSPIDWADASELTIAQIKSGDWDFKLKPKTILLNGVELPAPFEPKEGDKYFHINPYDFDGYTYDTLKAECVEYTQFGAWRTELEIKQVVAALRKVFGGV